jgi:hypothetical protein
MQLLIEFVQSSRRRRKGPGNGPAYGLQTFSYHICPQQVAFLGGELLRVLLLQVRRLCENEQFVNQRTVHAREKTYIDAHLH